MTDKMNVGAFALYCLLFLSKNLRRYLAVSQKYFACNNSRKERTCK